MTTTVLPPHAEAVNALMLQSKILNAPEVQVAAQVDAPEDGGWNVAFRVVGQITEVPALAASMIPRSIASALGLWLAMQSEVLSVTVTKVNLR